MMRIGPAKRSQFLCDVIAHDIELKELGIDEVGRRDSLRRFIKTFGGE
jgi:hypothetical protein